ncbi:MAG: hypothetical protein ACD_23C00622G0001 [uncultured bacterium]|nr:MAG: hypothetical protein ACD_23C00622G0001 [uncultured bacterium]
MFAGHDLALAKTLLCRANPLGCQQACHHTAHVQHAAHFFLGTGALTFGVDFLKDFLHHVRLRLGTMLHHHRVVTLGTLADIFQIWLCTRPPGTKHFFARVADSLRFLDGGGGHHAPGLQNHVVRAIAAHLQPSSFLLNARRGNRQQLQGETILCSTLLQDGQQLFAKWAVVVAHANFFALELVHTTGLFAKVLQQCITCHPIVADQRKIPFENTSVSRIAAPVARGDHRNLVSREFFGQRKGDAGGQRLKHRGTAVLAFEPLVAFHTTIGGVGRFAFFNQGLDTVDAATHVDQFHIVVVPIGPRRGVRSHRSGAPGQHREKLLFSLRKGTGPRYSQQTG